MPTPLAGLSSENDDQPSVSTSVMHRISAIRTPKSNPRITITPRTHPMPKTSTELSSECDNPQGTSCGSLNH